jgi:hypothetical protein
VDFTLSIESDFILSASSRALDAGFVSELVCDFMRDCLRDSRILARSAFLSDDDFTRSVPDLTSESAFFSTDFTWSVPDLMPESAFFSADFAVDDTVSETSAALSEATDARHNAAINAITFPYILIPPCDSPRAMPGPIPAFLEDAKQHPKW